MTILQVSALAERLRGSLFFVPLLFVIGGAALAEVTLSVDQRLSVDAGGLPIRLTSTVDSARAILSTVASATITFAGIAFSVALLIFQLASSQYSPRVIHGLFRDPFNKRIMGVVVGTFTYCLLVLRTVRSPIDSGSDPIIPHLSVAIAVLLGIGTVLAVVGFIDHAAHRMDVSQILDGVVALTLDRVEPQRSHDTSAPLVGPPTGPCLEVLFDHHGWVQQYDAGALLSVAPSGGVVRLDTFVGRYAFSGTTACTLWPPPPADETERTIDAVRKAIHLGDTRTMQQDAAYGLRQIVDVALRALSPGVNDPTTAQDAIFHACAVLHALLRAPIDEVVVGEEARRLLLPQATSAHELVELTFDEVRRAAAPHPTVCVYLLEAMALLVEALRHEGLAPLTRPIEEQARLVVDGAAREGHLPYDLDRIGRAHARRFNRQGAV